nr:DUF1048 domain-containing protein [Eubacterium sp.]
MADYMQYAEKLQGEYKEVFGKAEMFVGLKNMEGKHLEEMMMDLLDLLLTAQSEGKAVEKVVGTDMEKFCKSYFSGFTAKYYLKEAPRYLYRMMWLVFIFELLEIFTYMINGEFQWHSSTSDIGGYMTGFLTGWLFLVIANVSLRPLMFRVKWLTSGVCSVIFIVGFIVILIASCHLIEMVVLQVPVILSASISGGYVLIYFVVRSIWRYRHHGSIRKEKDPLETPKPKFSEMVARELPGQLLERYEKKNMRRMRKGKPLMTPEEYMDVLRKENRRSEISGKFWIAACVLFLVIMIVNVAKDSTVVDTLFFIGILLVVEIPAVLLFRFSFWSDRKRRELVEECERRGITIVEYVEEEKQKIE